VLHGGAWSIPDEIVEDHVRGVQKALATGWRQLEDGASALTAVEAAIISMEDDEVFDAGYGSALNREGRVQLDAMIMDGATLQAGGVGCVERIRNPIKACRLIMQNANCAYFVGEGAERFVQERGIHLCRNDELVVSREVRLLREAQTKIVAQTNPGVGHDTVGAVALDLHGNIAAGTSTGGNTNKPPGRVGDSSIIGCGCYADNESAAVSCTGWGEPFLKLVLAKWAADRVRDGCAPSAACSEALSYLKTRLNGYGGMIVLDRLGRLGIAHNTTRMAWAYKSIASELAGTEIK
jgi:beta-aspartyl-peptidase (threonine type)